MAVRVPRGTDALDRRLDVDHLLQHQTHGLLTQVPAIGGAKHPQQLGHGSLGQGLRCGLLRSSLSPVAPFTWYTTASSPRTTPSATATGGRERSSPSRRGAAEHRVVSVGVPWWSTSRLRLRVTRVDQREVDDDRRAPPTTPHPSPESGGSHAQGRANSFASAEIGRCGEAAPVRPRHGTVRP